MLITLAAFVLLGIAPSPSQPISQARVGQSCYDSLLVIGTDNVPVGNGKPTTIVNIWALLKQKSGDNQPIAWIYKNAAGNYWIQVAGSQSETIRKAFPSGDAARLLQGATAERRSTPQRVPHLSAYDSLFARVGAIRQACFSRDLSKKYY
jgi:hypothetical protein